MNQNRPIPAFLLAEQIRKAKPMTVKSSIPLSPVIRTPIHAFRHPQRHLSRPMISASHPYVLPRRVYTQSEANRHEESYSVFICHSKRKSLLTEPLFTPHVDHKDTSLVP